MFLGMGKQIRFRNGKRIGIAGKDGVFRVFKKEKRHLFRIYNGRGKNLLLLKELKQGNYNFIEIHTSDTKKIYRTHIQNFFEHGIPYKNPKNEKDPQLILPLDFFEGV